MTQGAKPVLAVDVDDVLYPLIESFAAYNNQHHGTSITRDDFFNYVWEDVLEVDVDQLASRVRDFGDRDGFVAGPPAPNAQEAIKKLSEHYELVVVTSRWEDFEKQTTEWLHEYFPDTFKLIHFANSITWSRGDKRDKASICQDLGAVAFIDDSLDNIEKVSATGITSLLFGDYPWNQTEKLPDNVQRVKDWNEVLEVLL